MAKIESLNSERNKFRDYLEHSGVITQLTRALVGLYEEQDRPDAAIEYVRKYLGSSIETEGDSLQAENEALKLRIIELETSLQDASATDDIREENAQLRISVNALQARVDKLTAELEELKSSQAEL